MGRGDDGRMKGNTGRFTPEARDAAYRRLRHLTVSLAGASFAAAVVLGAVAHATIPGVAGQGVASTAATADSSSSSAGTSTGSTSSESTSSSSSSSVAAATATTSGSGVAVSGGS
jgi:hypothetical protein